MSKVSLDQIKRVACCLKMLFHCSAAKKCRNILIENGISHTPLHFERHPLRSIAVAVCEGCLYKLMRHACPQRDDISIQRCYNIPHHFTQFFTHIGALMLIPSSTVYYCVVACWESGYVSSQRETRARLQFSIHARTLSANHALPLFTSVLQHYAGVIRQGCKYDYLISNICVTYTLVKHIGSCHFNPSSVC